VTSCLTSRAQVLGCTSRPDHCSLNCYHLVVEQTSLGHDRLTADIANVITIHEFDSNWKLLIRVLPKQWNWQSGTFYFTFCTIGYHFVLSISLHKAKFKKLIEYHKTNNTL